MIQTRGMSPTFDRDPRKSKPRFLAFAIPFGWILDPKKFDVGIDLAISKIKRISPESVDVFPVLPFTRQLVETSPEPVEVDDFRLTTSSHEYE